MNVNFFFFPHTMKKFAIILLTGALLLVSTSSALALTTREFYRNRDAAHDSGFSATLFQDTCNKITEELDHEACIAEWYQQNRKNRGLSVDESIFQRDGLGNLLPLDIEK